MGWFTSTSFSAHFSKWPPGASPNVRSEHTWMSEAKQPRTRIRLKKMCPDLALVKKVTKPFMSWKAGKFKLDCHFDYPKIANHHDFE